MNKFSEIKKESPIIIDTCIFMVGIGKRQTNPDYSLDNMKKNNKVLLTAKCAGIVAVCFVCSITALANSSSEICYAMQNIPVIGAITKVVTFRTYEDKNSNFTLNYLGDDSKIRLTPSVLE